MNKFDNIEEKITNAFSFPAPSPAKRQRDRQAILQLATQPVPKPAPFWRPVWKPVLAGLLVLTALVFAIGPGKVWAQLQTLFGFVPELGVVAPQSTIMVLPEPVKVTQGRTTLRIDQVVLGPESTFVHYYFTGVPAPKFMISLSPQQCEEKAWLQTSDGTRYYEANQGQGDFAALPAGTASLELRVPCIRNTLIGQANADWQAPLTLVASAIEPTLLPVIAVEQSEMPGETVASAETEASPQSGTDLVANAVADAITVEKLIPSERGMILLLRSKAAKTVNAALQSGYFEAGELSLWDANNEPIPYRIPDNAEALISGLQNQVGSAYAIEVRALPSSGALRIEQQAYPVRIASDLSAEFTLHNPGSKLNVPGHFWTSNLNLDEAIRFGDYELKLEYLQTHTNTQARLVFEQGPQVLGLKATVSGASTPLINLEEYHQIGYRKFFLNFDYSSSSRADLHFSFTDPVVADPAHNLIGIWQPEAAMIAQNPAPLDNQPCLAYDKPLEPQPAASAFAQGRLLVTKTLVYEPKDNPAELPAPVLYPPLYLYDMNGKELMEIEPNVQERASLSPDGQWVAFEQETGLAIKHLESGEKRTLLEQGLATMLWSPDSKMLAFQGGSNLRLYIYHLDTGSYDTLPITQDMLVLDGWNQDGSQLYFSYLASGGKKMIYDLGTGVLIDDTQLPTMFTLNNGNYSGEMGQWVYSNRNYRDLYLYDPDTASTSHLAEGVPSVQPVWEKGPWLSTILVNKQLQATQTILVNTETCATLALPDLPGMQILDIYLP